MTAASSRRSSTATDSPSSSPTGWVGTATGSWQAAPPWLESCGDWAGPTQWNGSRACSGPPSTRPTARSWPARSTGWTERIPTPPDDPDSSPASTRGGQTTLTALAITGRSSHIAHVGDSRVYRLRDGLLELLTTDHTQVMELLRLRLVRPEQAARHPGRHLLTRSIGGDILVRTEARAGIPEPGDAFLLCTDGAWSSVSSGEIRAALEGDLAAGVSDLMACSAERGGDDNASVIALRILQLGDDGRTLRDGWRLPWQRRSRP